jgi:hypothetical protein
VTEANYSNRDFRREAKTTRRPSAQIPLRVPITVEVSNRGRERVEATGQLQEISKEGALFLLDRQLGVGDRVVLHVHCDHPAKGRVRIRFPSEVTKVSAAVGVAGSSQWQIAVGFRGRHTFLLDAVSGVN